MTTHWISPIARSNPRVIAGKAIFTEVSSCTAALPSPIIAICHGFACSQPAGAGVGLRSLVWVTPKPKSNRREGDSAIAIDVARQPPHRGEHVEMGQRLAERLA